MYAWHTQSLLLQHWSEGTVNCAQNFESLWTSNTTDRSVSYVTILQVFQSSDNICRVLEISQVSFFSSRHLKNQMKKISSQELLLGPCIREKISRGLHKTRTPRINGTKSMFTAYSTQGQLKPRLILAEGFWDGLIQAAAYLGRESVCINAVKRCPRLTEALNDCCSCCFQLYPRPSQPRDARCSCGKMSFVYIYK